MIRIAHFSDLHYCAKNLAEADRCFTHAVEGAIAAGVNVAVVSGDSTDHALDLHSPAAVRLARQLRRLADHCPVLLLQGTFSHEPPGTLGIFALLGGRFQVHVAERIGQVALTADGQWVASSGWCFEHLPAACRGLFTCVPTVNKATVAACVGAEAANQATGEHIARLLRGFAPLHRAAQNQAVPSVLVSHGTVWGCLTEHGVPMSGSDHEFTTGALFAAEAQACLLGHIHRHQTWAMQTGVGNQLVGYAGSIGRFHHGEAGDKGWLLWVVDANGARCELRPTPARRTIDLAFDGPPDLDVLREAVLQQDIAGAFVRVRWTVLEEERQHVDRKGMGLLLSEAAEVKLEGRILPMQRARSAGIAQLVDLEAQVQAWARSAEIRPEPVLECLRTLSSETPQAIAERVLLGSAAATATGAATQAQCTTSAAASVQSSLVALV